MNDRELARGQKLAATNFYARTIELRDHWRAEQKRAIKVIKGKELPLEINPQGLMRWYLHPDIHDTAIRTYFFYLQEIPPGSRSGKLRHPGEVIIYIKEGRGYTLLDGERYEWKARDLLTLPVRPDGVVFQHFNTDTEVTAKLAVCEPNVVDSLGVDRGGGLEQIEPCPEWEEAS